MKKRSFKILVCCFIMVTCVFSTSVPAMAASYSTGKAVLPAYSENSATLTYFIVSNITDDSIDITVTFYNVDGTLVTDDNSSTTGRILAYNVLDYSDQNTDSTATFTLDAHCSGKIVLSQLTNTSMYGHGIIQWKQDGGALQGLVVSGGYYITNTNNIYTGSCIPVNGGLPF